MSNPLQYVHPVSSESLPPLKEATPILFRGFYSKELSVRGTVESVPTPGVATRYFVRLENGNGAYCDRNQLREDES